MVNYLGIYNVAKAFIQDIYTVYKKKNISDLIPYFDGLREDKKIDSAQRAILEPQFKKLIDEIVKFCRQIIKIPNFEILSHCFGFVALKDSDDWLKENLTLEDLEGLKEHLIDNLELTGDIDLKNYMVIWNDTKQKVREKAFDVQMDLYITEITSTAKEINNIYDIDEILHNWSLFKTYPDFELVISFLLLGV